MDHDTYDQDDCGRALKRRRVHQAASSLRQDVLAPECLPSEVVEHHGHRIDHFSVGDKAQAHVGDNITNHYHGQKQPQRDTYNTLLASLAFDRMDARLRNVATALPTTCEWLPRHEQFAAWIDESKIHEHHGLLWIKGKPGSGKSTIMKETLKWAEQEWSTQVNLSYFFNARSPQPLEKSSLGVYRYLLHQLLCLLPDSRACFVRRFTAKVNKNTVEEWTETELQNCLIKLVTRPLMPPINIFIDALDEGIEDDIRPMLRFLERLTQHAVKSAFALRICISSRHYPNISVRRSLSLVMEEQIEHSRDIELYIHSQLVGEDSPEMDDLRWRLQVQSSGVFLWVVLVVPVLNKAYDQGKSSAVMLRKLEEIPSDLHDVFAQIFFKDTDDLEECVVLLRWVLFSKRPLTPLELYHAVQYTCSGEAVNDSPSETSDVVIKYILNCSRGLVELTTAQGSYWQTIYLRQTEQPTVQFIHETVRGYLQSGGLIEQQTPGEPLSTGSRQDFQADSCHLKLSETSLRYLFYLNKQNLPKNEVLSQCPLARYAAAFWWRHWQSSQSPCTRRVLDLAFSLLTGNYADTPLWAEYFSFEGEDSYMPEPLRMTKLAPPLFYAAYIGKEKLISRLLALKVNVNAYEDFCPPALHTAIQCGHDEVVKMLIDAGADVNIQSARMSSALQLASRLGTEKAVQSLVDAGAGTNPQRADQESALLTASKYGYEKIVQILINAGADPNLQNKDREYPLQVASKHGHEKVVTILLDAGVDVNGIVVRRYHWSPIRIAVEHGHEKVIQILLEHGAISEDENWLKYVNLSPLRCVLSSMPTTERTKRLQDAVSRASCYQQRGESYTPRRRIP